MYGEVKGQLEAELAAKSSTSELHGVGNACSRAGIEKAGRVAPSVIHAPNGRSAGRQVGRSAGRQVGRSALRPPLTRKVQRGDGARITRAAMTTSGRGEQAAFPTG